MEIPECYKTCIQTSKTQQHCLQVGCLWCKVHMISNKWAKTCKNNRNVVIKQLIYVLKVMQRTSDKHPALTWVQSDPRLLPPHPAVFSSHSGCPYWQQQCFLMFNFSCVFSFCMDHSSVQTAAAAQTATQGHNLEDKEKRQLNRI